MQHRKRLSYLLATPLAVVAIAAPAAPAMPIQDARQQDMHSSTVQKPKATTQEDLRGEAVADPKPAPEAPVGLPTWPRNPQTIALEHEPVAVSNDGDGVDASWPVSILALAGAALLGGTLGIAGARRQARTIS